MSNKYFLRRPIQVAKLSRLMAKAIDLFIVLILSLFFYPLGVVFAISYLALADGLQNGQSVGKKFIGLRVISLEDGSPCNTKQSAIRNLPLIVPLIPSIFPIWGWIFALLIGIPLVGLEIYLIYKLDSGHRLGDVMADTSVMANDQNKMAIEKQKKASWFDSTEIRPLP